MALYLEIIRGKNVGSKFRLVAGLRVGRTKGEILLNEPKASALHGQVESDANGALFLADLDSSNGIKFNGLRMRRGPLELGCEVLIGATLMRVVWGDSAEEAATTAGPINPGWKQTILRAADSVPLQSLSPVDSLQAFTPPLQLCFLEGPQADLVLTLGYGPRRAGADNLDIDLQEESSPLFAFEISVEPNGQPLFQTTFPSLVRVNDGSYKTRPLRVGDIIRIGKTTIRIGSV